MPRPASVIGAEQAVIAGAAETPYRRGLVRRSTQKLLADVTQRVLRNAGMKLSDIDGLGVSSMTLAPDRVVDLAFRLGLRTTWLMEDTNGGAAALNMLAHARRAVEAGDARTVLLLAGDRFGAEDFVGLVDNYNTAIRDHLAKIPFGGPNGLFALVTSKHMQATGLNREDYGRVAIAQRAWAAKNPGAVYRSALSMEDYLAAPMVAEPLGRYDCVPVVNGADAVIVTRADNARRGRPVALRSLHASHNHDLHGGDGLSTGLSIVADAFWAEADAAPADVDVVSVYDDYPVMVLIQLAELGFVADDDLKRFVRSELGAGSPAINTSGGQLSAGQAGFAGGAHGLVEIVRQLRGEARDRQVADARLGLVTGYGMTVYRYGACANVALLERTR